MKYQLLKEVRVSKASVPTQPRSKSQQQDTSHRFTNNLAEYNTLGVYDHLTRKIRNNEPQTHIVHMLNL